MTEDFLNKVNKKASEQLKSLRSPYQLEIERTKAAQLCMNIYRKVERVVFENDEKIVDVLEKIIREGLVKRR